jgi:uncharacterized protein YrzB (UPF0473 family)
MKKKNQKRKISSAFCLLFLALALLTNVIVLAQQPVFKKNISLPEQTVIGNVDNFGSGIIDVISANNLFFAYTADKVIVLDNDGQTIIKVLEFNEDEKYGKYNPVYSNPRLHMPGVNLMTIYRHGSEGQNEDLFIVTPSLNIMLLNTDPLNLTWTLVQSIPNDPAGLNLSHFKPLHGVCKIKYDSEHKRLYWLIKGAQRDVDPPFYQNCTGDFHAREVYFVVYDVSNLSNITEEYEYHDFTISGDFAHYKNKNICDFEFNRDDVLGSYDYFFLAKFNMIETWKFGDNPNTSEVEDAYRISFVETPDEVYGLLPGTGNESAYYKFGKMLYIDDGSIKKVVVFPYRYAGFSLDEPVLNPLLIYVIDAYTLAVSTIEAPNQRIHDAIYIPSSNNLVISYSADEADKILSTDPDSDIAYSQFNTSSQTFNSFTTLSTNSGAQVSGIDVNSSTNLTSVNGQILVSKKDEVLPLISDGANFIAGSPILSAKNNFFGKGASGNLSSTAVIINKTGGKIEKFTSNGSNASHVSGIKTYFPTYHSVSNPMGTKLYFFNKLTVNNSGFYIFEPNEAEPVITHIDNFTSPIGDCIYNKFKGEFLLSQNENFGQGTAASIIRYSENNTVAGAITLQESGGSEVYYQNATKMFIDPNGILYVLVNSVVDDFSQSNYGFPYILTFDASTYEFIKSFELDDFTSADIINTSEYYMAHFCYSKSNNTTYFTILPQDISFPPYHAEYNNMFSQKGNYTPNNGYLYSIKNDILTTEKNGDSFVHPGKVICPDDGNDDNQSPLEGMLFIVCDVLKTYTFSTSTSDPTSQWVNDIVYSPYHDKVFAFADESHDGDCLPDRTAVVYEVTATTFSITFDQILNGTYNGQVSSFFLNPYNNRLYMQTKFDNVKLGDSPAKLIEFDIDPGTSAATKTTIDLHNSTYHQNRSFYSELDHCGDFNFYTNNLTTPTIDPYRNIMYLPGGGFSNVSTVEFTPEETLILNGSSHNGISWISIPRHMRTSNNTTPIENVFDPSNISGDLSGIEIEYNFINENFGAGQENIITSEWTISGGWVVHQDNKEVSSTRGYIVSHAPVEQKTLTLKGTIESPDSFITLYCKKDNWIGYYLYEEQNVFDALADIEDQVYHIIGQDFNCYRYNYPVSNFCDSKSTDDYLPGTWVCNKRPTNIKYGDMIKVSADNVSTISNFQWNYSGNPPSSSTIPALVYFEYEEKPELKTFVVELDTTTANPDEIGAIINDTCVGASSVNDQDSVIVITAYMDDNQGNEVTFQKYSSSKSTTSIINDYLVLNNETRKKEKRIIKTGEDQDVYIISFRDDPVKKEVYGAEYQINIYPNPAETVVNIEYRLSKTSNVSINIIDAIGRKIAELLNSEQTEGPHSVTWNIMQSGNKVGRGIYFMELNINGKRIIKKVIVN